MVTLGIDIGFHGAIASIENGNVEVTDMPVLKVSGKKNRLIYDLLAVKNILDETQTKTVEVWIEKVAPVMAKFGASSGAANFRLGYGLGMFEAMLECLEIEYHLVTPMKWKKHFGIVKPKGAGKEWNTKVESYKVAHRLFPDVELTTKRGRILDGRCDALLIAEYGRRNCGKDKWR